MTVATITNRVLYNGDDSTVAFPFTFPITQESDLEVTLRDSDGTETVLTLTTHYAVSASPWTSGGTVTTVATYATGQKILIRRVMTLTQATDYVENDPFPAETHEAALDKLTMITQQLDEENDRAIKLPSSSAYSDISVPDPESEKVLRWNTAGTDLENVNVSSLGDLVTTTPFTESFLDDADADTALSTLGFSTFFKTLIDDADAGTFRTSIDVYSKSETDALDTVVESKLLTKRNIKGLELALGADTSHDLSWSTGYCSDEAETKILVAATALVKRLDEIWAAGTNAGGLLTSAISTGQNFTFTNGAPDTLVAASGTPFASVVAGDVIIVNGTVSNDGTYSVTAYVSDTEIQLGAGLFTTEGPLAATINIVKAATTYYAHLIEKDSDSSCDIGYDDNDTCTNIPAGYTNYRVLAQFNTTAAAIINASTIFDKLASPIDVIGNQTLSPIIGLDPLAEYTAANDASIDITSIIDGTYDKYFIECIDLVPANDNVALRARVSADNGTSWKSGASDYKNSSTLYTSLEVGTPTGFGGWGSAAGEGGYASFLLSNPYGSAIYKMVSYYENKVNGGGNITGGQAEWAYIGSASDQLNAFQLYFASGNIESGTIRIYGVRT